MATSTDHPPAFPARWQVSSPVLINETFSSQIWRVTTPDGSLAVIKALRDFPDVWDELRGAFFLRWRDGVGAVRLLDIEGRMMLLEHGGGRLLADVIARDGDNAATEIAAEALARLASPSSHAIPLELQPLRERFTSLFGRAAQDRQARAKSIYADAAEIADALLSETADIRPLHGDLHHDNIIAGPRGWLAIDPKGVLGDPCFDAANLFYNPLHERDRLCLSPARIGFMAETFAAVLSQSPTRILDFAFAYGCLSAAWHAEDGNVLEESLELGVAQAIRGLLVNF